MKQTFATALLMLCASVAVAQTQIPPTSLPSGESRLPTEGNALPPRAGVANDCRAQLDTVRDQYRLQESSVRREMADREKLASESEKSRLRSELEQRLSAIRLQAAEAERRVQESCRT